jgi:hypothetical protein
MEAVLLLGEEQAISTEIKNRLLSKDKFIDVIFC